MKDAALYAFCFGSAASAIGLLFIRSLFKAALLLLICLLSLAGIYVLLSAELVAVAQILVYAGGVIILIIFGIMLTTRTSGVPLHIGNGNIFSGILASVLLFALVAGTFSFSGNSVLNEEDSDGIRESGMALMTSHVLPFELAGILLLIALIAASVIATSNRLKP